MVLPEIPKPVVYVLCLVALLVGARFRLSGLLLAGNTPPGPKRILRTAWLLGLDAAALASITVVLRLKPFPILMASIITIGATVSLLWVQWFFHFRAKAAAAGAGAPLQAGMQGLQNAALAMGFGKAEEWVKQQYRLNRWRLGFGYQGVMIGICFLLRVLETMEGGPLYILFSLIWQSGVTGVLYWQFDRQKDTGGGTMPPPHPANPTGPTPRPSGPPSPAAVLRTAGSRLPFSVPGAGRRPGTVPPGATPPPPPPVQPSSNTGKKSKKFAFRADVQAFVAFSAGLWCGVFSLWMGWWYGLASVGTFRIVLKVGSPLFTALLGRWIPPSLQGFIKKSTTPSLFSVDYLKSREFWYGPGMGFAGGLLGAAIRYLVMGR